MQMDDRLTCSWACTFVHLLPGKVAQILFRSVLNVFYVNWKSLAPEKHDFIYGDFKQEP
jgi:hypothetical protein